MPAKKVEETAVAVVDDENKKVIVREADPYAEFEFADDGVNEEKVVLAWPDIKHIQGTTRGIAGSERHVGQFYHPDTGEYEDDINVIPLAVRDQRAFFEDGSESPACVSLDGISPQPNQLLWTKENILVRGKGEKYIGDYPQPNFCADCPFSQFGEDGSAPDCNESVVMMVMRENGTFARFRITRTGLKGYRRAVNRLISGSRRLPVFSALWTLGSENMEKGNKKWQQLTIRTRPLDMEELREVNEIARTMRAQADEVAAKSAYEGGDSAADKIIDVDVDY